VTSPPTVCDFGPDATPQDRVPRPAVGDTRLVEPWLAETEKALSVVLHSPGLGQRRPTSG